MRCIQAARERYALLGLRAERDPKQATTETPADAKREPSRTVRRREQRKRAKELGARFVVDRPAGGL